MKNLKSVTELSNKEQVSIVGGKIFRSPPIIIPITPRPNRVKLGDPQEWDVGELFPTV